MKYLIEIFWSEEDKGYIAAVPDLLGCSAWGSTPEAAIHEIKDAQAWIEACIESGDPIPHRYKSSPGCVTSGRVAWGEHVSEPQRLVHWDSLRSSPAYVTAVAGLRERCPRPPS